MSEFFQVPFPGVSLSKYLASRRGMIQNGGQRSVKHQRDNDRYITKIPIPYYLDCLNLSSSGTEVLLSSLDAYSRNITLNRLTLFTSVYWNEGST